MANEYGLLIDYEYCTGCMSCEMACKVEFDLPEGQYGIKVLQDGPRQLESGKWDYTYLPIPTSLCDLCADRVAGGKLPRCVHHCQAACMTYGKVDDLAKLAQEKAKTCVFVPC